MKKIGLYKLYMCVNIIFFSLFTKTLINAQDIHYSQFYNPELNINPAKTGVFNGDIRLVGSFRDQWRTVPVPWQSLTATYDQKFYPKKSNKYFFSGGLNYNYDKQGDSRLILNNINGFGSFTSIINRNVLITIGIGLGYANRGFDTESLTWDQQWNENTGVFDPNRLPGENFGTNVDFIENSAGFNLRLQQSTRTKVDIGLGIYHVFEPQVSFTSQNLSNDVTLPRRFSPSIIANFQLTNNFDIQLHGLAQIQDDYNEVVPGGLLKFYLNPGRGKEFEFHFGGSYRTSGSFTPTFAIQYKNIYASFNYDIDVSDFDVITENKGGPEFHIRYIITRVKPLSQFKNCPIF